MKTRNFAYILVIILLISSCSVTKKLEKKLIGKYSVEMLKSGNTEKPSDAFNNMLKDLLKGSYIQFNPNKTYELNLVGKKSSGTWLFLEDGKTILTDTADIKFQISKFTDTGLELNNFNKNDTILMILKKINE